MRTTSHGGTVAAALADDRSALAGDRALVDGGNAFDDLTVAGDQIARQTEYGVAAAERLRAHILVAISIVGVQEPLGGGRGA